MSKAMSMSSHGGGHLYMQTNEVRNCVVHYRRGANGAITEVERTATSPATGAALVESAERHFGGLDKFDSGTCWPSFTTQGGGR